MALTANVNCALVRLLWWWSFEGATVERKTVCALWELEYPQLAKATKHATAVGREDADNMANLTNSNLFGICCVFKIYWLLISLFMPTTLISIPVRATNISCVFAFNSYSNIDIHLNWLILQHHQPLYCAISMVYCVVAAAGSEGLCQFHLALSLGHKTLTAIAKLSKNKTSQMANHGNQVEG